MKLLPKNVYELQQMIQTASKGQYGTFDDVQWFLCYQQAQQMADWSTKDIARALMGGDITGIRTEEDCIQAIINQWYPDFDEIVSYDQLETDSDKETYNDIAKIFWEVLEDFYG